MDAFDPKNDLIDQYLRGELEGAALEEFLRKLQGDPELKQDVEFRRLLASGIHNYGRNELKKYIRERTNHRRVMRISRRVWFYAAAAVGLILVSGIAVIMVNQGKHSGVPASEIATADTTVSENQEDPALAKNKTVVPGTAETPLNDPGVEDTTRIAMIEEVQPESVIPEAVTVASNISVIPIRIQPLTKEPEGTRAPVQVGRPKKAEDEVVMSQGRMDSLMAEHSGSMKPVYTSGDDDAAKFRLSFLETREGQPAVSFRKGEIAGNDVTVYNLPYDNPLIFNYQSRYFLKTGDKFYEIKTGSSGIQPVKAITDPALIKALSK